MTVMLLICFINYWSFYELRNIPNEIEMYEKWTLYNYKETKIDEVEPKRRGTLVTKRGLSNQQVCIITIIQRF